MVKICILNSEIKHEFNDNILSMFVSFYQDCTRTFRTALLSLSTPRLEKTTERQDDKTIIVVFSSRKRRQNEKSTRRQNAK
jgi:hypothetical protein